MRYLPCALTRAQHTAENCAETTLAARAGRFSQSHGATSERTTCRPVSRVILPAPGKQRRCRGPHAKWGARGSVLSVCTPSLSATTHSPARLATAGRARAAPLPPPHPFPPSPGRRQGSVPICSQELVGPTHCVRTQTQQGRRIPPKDAEKSGGSPEVLRLHLPLRQLGGPKNVRRKG